MISWLNLLQCCISCALSEGKSVTMYDSGQEPFNFPTKIGVYDGGLEPPNFPTYSYIYIDVDNSGLQPPKIPTWAWCQ
jgi:hypothetical protein